MAAHVISQRSGVTPTVVSTTALSTIPAPTGSCSAMCAWTGGLGSAIWAMLSPAARLTQTPTARRRPPTVAGRSKMPVPGNPSGSRATSAATGNRNTS
jgi:hypothetical protein